MNNSIELVPTRLSPNGKDVPRCQGVVDDKQCKHMAMRGRRFCKYHGGKALIGPDTQQFRHGLCSLNRKRFAGIGGKLLSRIEELRQDPDLFDLRDDAAYMTALIDNRAEAASEGFSVEILKQLQQLYASAKRSYRAGETEDFIKAFDEIGRILEEGGDEARAANEVVELIGRRVALVEAEQRVAHAKAYTLEVDQAYSLVMQVVGVVKQSVRNADELAAIKAGIGRLLKTYKQQEEEEIVDAEVVDET